ncbi:MAG: ABC transporter permease [Planctomycetes bacterium]|nr:ABC transporter permease [Planctomycetota bacterium]
MIVHGVDKSKFQRFRAYQVTEGSLDEFMAARDGALVGASIARRKGWTPGRTVDLQSQLGLLMEVKGVFFSGNEEQDNTILADIEFVQDRYDARGKANQLLVKLAPDAPAEDVAAAIDAMPLPVRTSTQPEKAFLSAMLEDLADLITLASLVVAVTMAVVFLSVANTVAMSVRDRVRQIGVLRTLGFKRWQIMFLLAGESAIVCVAGGLAGAGAAWLVLSVQQISVQSRALNLVISMPWQAPAAGLLVALFVGVLGAAWPAWRASRMNIVQSLGSVS